MPEPTVVDPDAKASAADQPRPVRVAFRKTADYLGLLPAGSSPPDSDSPGDYGLAVARLHGNEDEVGTLTGDESRRLLKIRLFGATGAVLVLVGSLGTGALPVLQNPIAGSRVLSLPSRMWPTALTFSFAGTVILVLAWLLLAASRSVAWVWT